MIKLLISDKEIEFPEEILKISSYLKYLNDNKEYNEEPIPILNYDKEIFDLFTYWFDKLIKEGIVEYDNDKIKAFFYEDLFIDLTNEFLEKIFNFALSNQIDLLVQTLAFVLRDKTDNCLINNINNINKPLIRYTRKINKLQNSIYGSEDCKKIKKLIVPYDVEEFLFDSYCPNLKEIIFTNPETVISKSSNFEECENLNLIKDNVIYRVSTDTYGEYVIPDGITKISYYAFANCQSIFTIKIPDSVISIEDGAFYKCLYLDNINQLNGINTLPNYLSYLGDYAFCCCESLENIDLTNIGENIGNYAFAGCYSLKSITMPSNLEEIGEYAFCKCYSLKHINSINGKNSFPNTLSDIHNNAFEECESLKKFTISHVYNVEKDAFLNCSDLKFVEILDPHCDINYDMFETCNENFEIYFDKEKYDRTWEETYC